MTPSVTEFQTLAALRAFIMGVLPGIEVVRGQDNLVDEPAGPDFVVMTPVLRTRLSTNRDGWDRAAGADPVAINVLTPTQVTVQIDVHGPNSTDNAHMISALLRDDYACQVFAASGYDVTPLYAEDPQQTPFTNGENQIEYRWVVDAALQINPVLSPPQDFATTLTATTVELSPA